MKSALHPWPGGGAGGACISRRFSLARVGLECILGFLFAGEIAPAMRFYGLWLSLVERSVRDGEVVGSNPASPIFRPPETGGARVRQLPSFSTSSTGCFKFADMSG